MHNGCYDFKDINIVLQVDFVEPAQNYVHLKLIPRIDYTKPRGFAKTKDNNVSKNTLKIRYLSKYPTFHDFSKVLSPSSFLL